MCFSGLHTLTHAFLLFEVFMPPPPPYVSLVKFFPSFKGSSTCHLFFKALSIPELFVYVILVRKKKKSFHWSRNELNSGSDYTYLCYVWEVTQFPEPQILLHNLKGYLKIK